MDDNESSEAHGDDVWGAESPAEFKRLEAGGGGDAIEPDGSCDEIAGNIEKRAEDEHFLSAPSKVGADVVGEDDVAEESGEVP